VLVQALDSHAADLGEQLKQTCDDLMAAQRHQGTLKEEMEQLQVRMKCKA